MTHQPLTIGELAARSGLSTHTLRYYESQGILRPARRAANGHRRYHAEDLDWLAFVLRLKTTGMPLAEIRRYAGLRTRGESSLEARLAMLELHRQRLATTMKELSRCAGALDEKIRTYRTLVAKARPRSKTG